MPLRRLASLLATGLLAACQPAPATAPAPGAVLGPAGVALPAAGERSVTLRVQVAPARARALQQILVSGDTRLMADDVHHVVLTLYEGGSEPSDAIDSRDLPRARLGEPISFTRLKADTTYQIGAVAYDAPGTSAAAMISTDNSIAFTPLAVGNSGSAEPVAIAVRLFDRGERVITTWAGVSNALRIDGLGTIARFNAPRRGGLAPDGTFLVADTSNAAIRAIAPAGPVSTVVGSLNAPEDVASVIAGQLYIADTGNHRVAFYNGSGTSPLAGVALIAGYREGVGTNQSPITGPLFNSPSAVAVDGTFVYVADTGNHVIRKINRSTRETSMVAGVPLLNGFLDGPIAQARFKAPRDLALGPDGAIYVADTGNHAIRRIKDGTVTTLAGGGTAGAEDGVGPLASFDTPYGVAVDARGYVWVADASNHAIRRIAPDGTTRTWAGTLGQSGTADGRASAARLNFPTGVDVGPDGTLYVTEMLSGRIRRIQ